MARTVGIELLEQKIAKAQSDVVKTKQLYEVSVSKLGELMDKRDALVMTIMKSKKSYEEILRFLNDEESREE